MQMIDEWDQFHTCANKYMYIAKSVAKMPHIQGLWSLVYLLETGLVDALIGMLGRELVVDMLKLGGELIGMLVDKLVVELGTMNEALKCSWRQLWLQHWDVSQRDVQRWADVQHWALQ